MHTTGDCGHHDLQALPRSGAQRLAAVRPFELKLTLPTLLDRSPLPTPPCLACLFIKSKSRPTPHITHNKQVARPAVLEPRRAGALRGLAHLHGHAAQGRLHPRLQQDGGTSVCRSVFMAFLSVCFLLSAFSFWEAPGRLRARLQTLSIPYSCAYLRTDLVTDPRMTQPPNPCTHAFIPFSLQ